MCILWDISWDIEIFGEDPGVFFFHFVGGKTATTNGIFTTYPLVNVYMAMEHHHFQWEISLFLWSFGK